MAARGSTLRVTSRSAEPAKPQALAAQCVDQVLLDPSKTQFQLPGQDRFYLCRPSQMEYTPAPLTFVCRTCGLFRDYETLAKLDKDLKYLSPATARTRGQKARCDWEQLDVIFVHWSGHWEAAFPGQWHWSDAEGKPVKRRSNCVCGSTEFRLNRRAAGIGDWFFECAAPAAKSLSRRSGCRTTGTRCGRSGPAMGPERLTEVRMQATPYRASSAYYVKSDLFIDFRDGSQQLLSRLRPGQEGRSETSSRSNLALPRSQSRTKTLKRPARASANARRTLRTTDSGDHHPYRGGKTGHDAFRTSAHDEECA